MKDMLKNIINNDISYNKSATRYLYKTHPDLWEQIVGKTLFLSDSALPKQRIWHVLNEVWAIPLCPIEHIPVKWWENRYLITSSRTSKQKYKWSNGDYSNAHTEEANKNRSTGNKNAVTRGRKYRDQSTYSDTDRKKSKQTCLEKYGVVNGSQTKEAREKIYQASIKRGCTSREERSLRRIYYDAVWKITEESWKNHFDKINPTCLRRSKNALDHIYSIQQGFRDHIPAYIIGHWANLRVIPMVDNSLKGMKCHKTQNQLFEDFFACIN
jgi:hypothetical protein